MALTTFISFGYSTIALASWQLDSSLSALGETNARNTEPKQGDTNFVTQINIQHNKLSSSFNSSIDYALSKSVFLEGSNQDRVTRTGTIDLAWLATPRISLNANHIASDSISDSLVADIPDNRRQQNTTGLNANYRISLARASDLNLSLNSAFNTQEDQPQNDSYRYGGTLRLVRFHNRFWDSSIVLSGTEVDFTSKQQRDYDVSNFLFGFNRTFNNSRLEFSAGYNVINREGQRDFDGSQISINWQSNNNTSRQYSIRFIKRLTDTSIGLIDVNSSNPGSSNRGVSSSNVYIEEASELSASLNQRFTSLNANLTLSLSLDKSDFKTSSREDEGLVFNTSISKPLANQYSFTWSFSHTERKQLNLQSERITDTTTIQLSKQFSRRLSGSLRMGYEQDELSTLLASNGQIENSFYNLTINYRLL